MKRGEFRDARRQFLCGTGTQMGFNGRSQIAGRIVHGQRFIAKPDLAGAGWFDANLFAAKPDF